jgi:hypothetical protein
MAGEDGLRMQAALQSACQPGRWSTSSSWTASAHASTGRFADAEKDMLHVHSDMMAEHASEPPVCS